MRNLLLDIETSPNLADVWGLWNQNVSLNQLRESSYTLCWAAKWHGEKKIFFGSEWGNPLDFIGEIWNLMDEADAITTYNGDHFDLKTLNKEFLLEGLGPPSPYRSIDLYKVVKKQFQFPSYKLEYVLKKLKLTQKIKHGLGHELWVRVLNGDKKAQALMAKYCKGDIFPSLEELHDTLLPWIPNYPNILLYTEEDKRGECVRCTEGTLQKRGFHYTANGKFQTYRCTGCGGWQRDSQRLDGVPTRPQ